MRTSLQSVSDFEGDPRRRQEIRCRPYADEIYRRAFNALNIERFEKEDNHLLDIKFAIDVKVTLPNGMVINGQEKFLSGEYSSYQTVTVEYKQNQFTGENGDWYKLACQFYFTGYESDNGFNPWIILNWSSVVLATNTGLIAWQDNANKNGRAKASFKYCKMTKFPKSCVIASIFTEPPIPLSEQIAKEVKRENEWLR